MIELGVVDLSADGRRRLSALIDRWAWSPPDSRISLPRISSLLLSPEEIRFHGSLDVCVVGPELIGCDAASIHAIRKQIPEKVLVAVLDSRTYSFGLVEQLGRLGVDDVLMDSATSEEFFRRILLLQRRIHTKDKGSLVIVDSARGGVGRTFISAAVAEGWYARGKKVCVVDCDVISQDLTRFLQVRPCFNEALRLLVDQQRVVTAETVHECVSNVWSEEPRFGCIAPPAGGDEALFASAVAQRGLLSVLDLLLFQFDRVIVDTSGLVSAARNILFQRCDEALFVMNRDISAAYANRQALSLISGFLRHDARLVTILNDNGVGSADEALIREQVAVTAGRLMTLHVVPRSRRASAWMCSGYTPYRFLKRSLESILSSSDSDAGEVETLRRLLNRFLAAMAAPFGRFRARLRGRLGSTAGKGGVSESMLGTAAIAGHSRLAIGCDQFEADALVTKPVLIG